MRVECESCHELVAASFTIAGTTVRATCPACAHVMSTEIAVAPDALCPKCGATRRGDAPCASCGLAAARMAAYAEAHDGASDAGVPEPVRAAWVRATAGWDEPARHDELLHQAAAHHCYPWVASRYRARGRDPVAERQLDRLRRAAEATLLAGATVRRDTTAGPYRVSRGMLALLIAAMAAGLLYATMIRGPSGASSAPVPARPLTPGHPVSPSTIR